MASGLTRSLLDIEESSKMRGEPIIALELIERIVDCTSADLPTLCKLSLVCETFYRRCRTHMFSRLDFGSRSLQSLLKLLEMYTYKHNCRLRICLLSHVHYLQLPFKSVEYVNQLLRISPFLVNLRALEFYGSGITREDLLFFKAPTLRVLEALPKTTRSRFEEHICHCNDQEYGYPIACCIQGVGRRLWSIQNPRIRCLSKRFLVSISIGRLSRNKCP